MDWFWVRNSMAASVMSWSVPASFREPGVGRWNPAGSGRCVGWMYRSKPWEKPKFGPIHPLRQIPAVK